jgi:hypothetical protein
MKKVGIGLLVAVMLLAGCKKSAPNEASLDLISVKEEAVAAKGGAEPVKVSIPQIAYTYSYGFQVPGDRIAAVQNSHVALCDQMGPGRCHVLNMQNDTRDGAGTGSTLKLVVEARSARSFAANLIKVVGSSGGTQSESSIEAEDLSKQIVDTEAHLRAKQALADRLMTLLKTRNGPVADLVAAERSVAEVQEEIDTAQSWLAEARGRVAMSTFNLSYEPDGRAGAGFWSPLKSSFGTMTSFFGQSLSIMVTLIAMLLPWILLGGAIFAGLRYVRRTFRTRDED